MRFRILVSLMIAGLGLSAPSPVFASSKFHILLTNARVVVAQGSEPITLTFWNDGSDALPVTVTTSQPWITVSPTSFVAASGQHFPVLVTFAPEGRGKGYVIFAVDAGTNGTIRVIRELGAVLYVGVPPPLPVAPQTPFEVPWLLLLVIGSVGLVAVMARRLRLKVTWR